MRSILSRTGTKLSKMRSILSKTQSNGRANLSVLYLVLRTLYYQCVLLPLGSPAARLKRVYGTAEYVVRVVRCGWVYRVGTRVGYG